MKFSIKESQRTKAFDLVYNESEHSFIIEPFESGIDFTSITIDTLQLEIDDEGRIMYVWGYYPLTQYRKTMNFPDRYEKKDLVAILGKIPTPGVSISMTKKESRGQGYIRWPTYINQEEGWVCIGDPTIIGKRMIEFAPSCVAAIDDSNEMMAVWLHPVELPKICKK